MIRGLAITAVALGGAALTVLGKRVQRDASERGVGLGAAVSSLSRTLPRTPTASWRTRRPRSTTAAPPARPASARSPSRSTRR